MPKVTLSVSPVIGQWQDQAAALGLSLPALLTADLRRYRTLAAAAEPSLTGWEWDCLAHVLSGVEAHAILTGIDDLPSPGAIVAEIDAWAAGGAGDDIDRAAGLDAKVRRWSPLAVAAVLFRLRDEAARKSR